MLVACTPSPPQESLPPPQRPVDLVPTVVARSNASVELAAYYQSLEQKLLTLGLLRTDGGGPDTPYDADDLIKDFETIAFYDEYAGRGAITSGALARWQKPVRIVAEFGPTVSLEQRDADQKAVANFANRLARVTGHPISSSSTPNRSNFHVLFAGKDDSVFVVGRLQEILPNISPAELQFFAFPDRKFYCLVLSAGKANDPLSYSKTVVLIRDENPGLLRQSCVHEEIAQGLGLRNDSPYARPSIFNDNDEFALLTSHDENLLTMLYDERLHPGMSAKQARPLSRIIAHELLGQPL